MGSIGVKEHVPAVEIWIDRGKVISMFIDCQVF